MVAAHRDFGIFTLLSDKDSVHQTWFGTREVGSLHPSGGLCLTRDAIARSPTASSFTASASERASSVVTATAWRVTTTSKSPPGSY